MTTPQQLEEHDPDCTQPGWQVQQRLRPHLPVIACCRGCQAIRIRRPDAPGITP